MTLNRTIYVDMDDVICETCRGFLQLLETEYDRRVAFEDVKVFDLGISFSMSAAEIEEFMVRAHQPEFLGTLSPMSGALEALQKWVESGYRIDIMTGRPPSTRECTQEWLKRNEVGYHSLKFVDKYGRGEIDSSFDQAMTLTDLAAEKYCLAVEDSAATASFLAEHEVAPVALIDRPWNRRGVNGNITRMTDWRELARVCATPGI